MVLSALLPGTLGVLVVFSGVFLGVGLWTLATPRRRSPVYAHARSTSVVERIAHSLRDVSPHARTILHPPVTDPLGASSIVLSPTFQAAAHFLHRVAGGGSDEQLDRAGWQGRHGDYRTARFLAAVAGLALSVGLGVVALASGLPVTVLTFMVLAGLGVIGGVGLFDRWIRRTIKRRHERLSEEFPTVIELLALALSAGDSLHGALRRIASRGNGELAREWARVLRTVELGQPLGPSLSKSARAMGVEEIEALVDHLVQALERGAPLAEVVRAHSSDSRLRQLRAVVDRAGKAEVLMLIPLVLLILPITVIFAVWPSLHTLQWSF